MRERLEDFDFCSADQGLAEAITIEPNVRARLQQLDEAKRSWRARSNTLEG